MWGAKRTAQIAYICYFYINSFKSHIGLLKSLFFNSKRNDNTTYGI